MSDSRCHRVRLGLSVFYAWVVSKVSDSRCQRPGGNFSSVCSVLWHRKVREVCSGSEVVLMFELGVFPGRINGNILDVNWAFWVFGLSW